jgi:hypothetical protein
MLDEAAKLGAAPDEILGELAQANREAAKEELGQSTAIYEESRTEMYAIVGFAVLWAWLSAWSSRA